MLVHEDDLGGVDAGEIGAARGDDGVEVSLRCVCDVVAALACPGIGVDDDDLPAGELEHSCMDAGEAELEHPAGPVSQQLEDPRSRGGGESGRKPMHRYARYMSRERTGKFLGVPYDWSRFGWGYDFNLAEVARRLGLKH